MEVWWTSHSSGWVTQIGRKIKKKKEKTERTESAVTVTVASNLAHADGCRSLSEAQ